MGGFIVTCGQPAPAGRLSEIARRTLGRRASTRIDEWSATLGGVPVVLAGNVEHPSEVTKESDDETLAEALERIGPELLPRRIGEFALAFVREDPPEAPYQRRIAEMCGSEHHEIVVERGDALEALDDFFATMDQPTVDGFNVFVTAREAARRGVRVCLTGA